MDPVSLACGIGFLRAAWMNRFATLKSFLTVYSILGMIQAMAFIYFAVTLTTIERRFKIPGKNLGIVLSGNEVSQILLSLFLSYYGGNRNRPRWIAIGTLLSAISCFVLALPHFIYGPGEDAIRLTREYVNKTGESFINQISKKEEPLTHCVANKPSEQCETDSYTSDYSMAPLVLIFSSQFILGIGSTLYYVLGQIYIDDNAKKKNTPKLIGISMALRMIGPAFGFVLGFFCLRIYIDPTLDPIIKQNDPRWMGAWWIGWIFCGILMMIMAVILAMFPKQLPKKHLTQVNNDNVIATMEAIPLKTEKVPETIAPNQRFEAEDFPTALKRLLNNKLLINNIFSGVFALLGAAGFMTFLVKYLEIQFQRSSAMESLVAGPFILIGAVLGILGSGLYISRFKPPPKYLLLWNVIVGIIWISAQFLFIFLGCSENHLQNYSGQSDIMNLNGQCNLDCDCDTVKFSPVCYQPEKITYFSPCHAGCTDVHNMKFSQCKCLPELVHFDTIQTGYCETDCNTVYYIFLITMCVAQFASSSGRIGNMLVNYRCVNMKDKAFAQGLALWMVSIFALIPGPIIYGYIYDNACLIWDTRCSRQGNCWYYNRDYLRLTLNLTGMCLTGIATIFDFFVWKQGKNLNLYDDFPLMKDRKASKESI